MPTTIVTYAYGYEKQANGKVKLFLSRDGGSWEEISPTQRGHFHRAVNEYTDIQPDGVMLMDVWEILAYDLPDTPWDWLTEGET